MAIQGIIQGFADPQDTTQHAMLIGRGQGYSVVVNGYQSGEQEATIDAGLSALSVACRGKPRDWREVRATAQSSAGITTVTELGTGIMGDFDI